MWLILDCSWENEKTNLIFLQKSLKIFQKQFYKIQIFNFHTIFFVFLTHTPKSSFQFRFYSNSFFSTSWNVHWVIYVSFVNESRRCRSRAVFYPKVSVKEKCFLEKKNKKERVKFLEIPDKFIYCDLRVKLRSLWYKKNLNVNEEKLVDLARLWKANVLNTSDENKHLIFVPSNLIFLGLVAEKVLQNVSRKVDETIKSFTTFARHLSVICAITTEIPLKCW